MKTTIFATAAFLLTTPVWAGEGYRQPTGQTQGQGQSQSQGQSQQQRAQSRSTATGGNSRVTVNQQAGGGSGGGRDGSLVLMAPAVNSANNCAVGGSLGGGTPRSSGLLGWLFEADDCKVDRRLGVIRSIDGNDAAREYLCRKDMDARWVARDLGRPCMIDVNRWARGER